MAAHPERRRREREHAGELSAAENADGRSGLQHVGPHVLVEATSRPLIPAEAGIQNNVGLRKGSWISAFAGMSGEQRIGNWSISVFGPLGDGASLPLAPGIQTFGKPAIRQRQNGGSQQRRIDGAGFADRKRANGNSACICMIESSESLPSSACVLMGTPKTGSGVSDAVMPGR